MLGRDEESLRVRTDDGRRLTVDAASEYYGVGGTVTVLEDGAWRRLAAEPYDPFGWQLLALAAGLPGLSMLTMGVLARRRAAALRRGLVSVLRVWLTGAFTVRHVPWEQLRTARYTKEGSAQILQSDGTIWRVPGLGMPWLERRIRHRPSYARMVEEVAALHTHPATRPTQSSTPRDHGLPMGPVAILLMVLVAAVAFMR
ncbi:hypothetical protein [Streptomyces bullii]|uniref:PH domain-containing protein n=1 Tax=Streptomyces bullii TaxID=349910 RepID=A0ABW0V3J7_9ACTN